MQLFIQIFSWSVFACTYNWQIILHPTIDYNIALQWCTTAYTKNIPSKDWQLLIYSSHATSKCGLRHVRSRLTYYGVTVLTLCQNSGKQQTAEERMGGRTSPPFFHVLSGASRQQIDVENHAYFFVCRTIIALWSTRTTSHFKPSNLVHHKSPAGH